MAVSGLHVAMFNIRVLTRIGNELETFVQPDEDDLQHKESM